MEACIGKKKFKNNIQGIRKNKIHATNDYGVSVYNTSGRSSHLRSSSSDSPISMNFRRTLSAYPLHTASNDASLVEAEARAGAANSTHKDKGLSFNVAQPRCSQKRVISTHATAALR